MIGVPPGYQGSDQDGELIKALKDEAVKKIVFVGYEKAHSKVVDIVDQLVSHRTVVHGTTGNVIKTNKTIEIAGPKKSSAQAVRRKKTSSR